ncbi:hypothetical protein GQ457_07G042210 [Hibiscus cannabinus]
MNECKQSDSVNLEQHVPFNPKYAQDATADSGQAKQTITQRFKSRAMSPLMEDGEDGKESNAYLKTINAVECDSSKSHELRYHGATLDTALPIENTEDVTENGKLELGANPMQSKEYNSAASLCDSLKSINVSGKRKRDAIEDEMEAFSYAKRKEIIEAINDGIIQLNPGNWGVEFEKKGMRYGARRLSLIKSAARKKHCLEVTRNAFDNVGIMEFGIDPLGMESLAHLLLELVTMKLLSRMIQSRIIRRQSAPAEEMSCVYKNPNAPIEDGVKDVVSRMTLQVQEKIGQMTQIELEVATLDDVRNLSIGLLLLYIIRSMVSGAGKAPLEKVMPSDWAETVDRFQQAALDSRLGIPLAYGIDAVHGNNRFYGATIFRHNIGLGATGIGAAVALEVRASGIHFNFAPCVAVCRDPRWGRCYESFSEDANIVRKMTSIITGLQGQPPVGHLKGYPFVAGRHNIIACAKHFVGDGGAENGLNEGNTISSYNDLERIHMAPYLDSNQEAQTIVIVFAINAGIDMVMVPHRYKQFIEDLTSLVESGEIKMSRIDDAVERILRVKFVAALFEYPFFDRSLLDTVGCKGNSLSPYDFLQLHRELAREAVCKSLVLLKNGKNPGKPFLPLKKNAKRVLIAGTHADDLGYQCRGWTRYWQGSSGRITIGKQLYKTNRALQSLMHSEKKWEKNRAVGEEPYAESAGDNAELNPHIGDPDIWKTFAYRAMASGKKTDALIAAWLPGTDVVFGDYEFEGRLPMTWFRTTTQLPINNGDNSCDPLFPLGFGLTCGKEKPTE